MKIHYTRKDFVTMPKNEKIDIIKSESFELPAPTLSFWDKLKQFKNQYKRKRA